MAKIIKLTNECKEKLQKEFNEYLDQNTLEDGKFSFSRVFESAEEKAKIIISPLAYMKMVSLLDYFNKEVAWHGEAYRGEDNTYIINDIMVYPQTVTGASVDMDTDEYANWIIDHITDDRFNHIRMQAHSHVHMATNPSSVDLQHQSEIVNQLSDDGFYIFMIWNKSLKCTNKIYDMQKNIMFEDKDISIELGMSEFIKEADSLVKDRGYSYAQTKTTSTETDSQNKDKEHKSYDKNSKKKQEKGIDDDDQFVGWDGLDRYLDNEFINAFEEDDLSWD